MSLNMFIMRKRGTPVYNCPFMHWFKVTPKGNKCYICKIET